MTPDCGHCVEKQYSFYDEWPLRCQLSVDRHGELFRIEGQRVRVGYNVKVKVDGGHSELPAQPSRETGFAGAVEAINADNQREPFVRKSHHVKQARSQFDILWRGNQNRRKFFV